MAPQIRAVGPAGGTDLALPAALAHKAVQRAQPAEKIHQPIFRTHGRQAPRAFVRPAGMSPSPQEYGGSKRRSGPLSGPSPPAKFGDFVPTVAQLIAHDSGFLRAQMPNEMRAFSRHLPADAYRATLDRSRYIMRDVLPLNAAA